MARRAPGSFEPMLVRLGLICRYAEKRADLPTKTANQLALTEHSAPYAV